MVIEDSTLRVFRRLQSLPDISRACYLSGDHAFAELTGVLTSVVAAGGEDPLAWLLTERPSFTARAALEQALFTLNAELVRPVAASGNPSPPPMGIYFDIPREEDDFPCDRHPLDRDDFPLTSDEILRALETLWRYRRPVADQQPMDDEWDELRSDLVRLDPGTDPEAWILSAHPHAAAVMALDYLVSGCTEVYSSI